MSIIIKDIKRNRLDYILTDVLPVEITELFTFRHFYEYLQNNHKIIENELKQLMRIKTEINNSGRLFDNSKVWTSIPLTFCIAKGEASIRQLSLLQPMAAMQLYYFICCYQDEILFHLKTNSMYSLRYHTKAQNLFYKQRKKMMTRYFSKTFIDLSKKVLEQTGRYFDLRPYSSIVNFTESELWFSLNLKYKYFSRIDYKSCFDSIYTHSYKWLLSKDVNDSKGFSNTNLFTSIDRVLQNINAHSSNGIVVGPEFSRLIAELLLQHVDSLVYSELLNNNVHLNKQYAIYRYVDDVFIFTDSENLQEQIIKLYNDFASKFLLYINERKIIRERLPFILSEWLAQANEYSATLSNCLFCTSEEYKRRQSEYGENSYLFKGRTFLGLATGLKRNFNDLIAKNISERPRLISYTLRTLLNRVSIAKTTKKIVIFPKDISKNNLYAFLDYVFYIYSHAPSFDNTQRIISIISYINDDTDLLKKYNDVMQQIIDKYSFVFEKSNSNDIINLLLFVCKSKLEIPHYYELQLKKKIFRLDDPLVSAVYLLYSRYNSKYHNTVKNELNSQILEKLDSIRQPEKMLTHREFWWVLVFNKSPYVDPATQQKFNQIIDSLSSYTSNTNVGTCSMQLFIDFLKSSQKQFMNWDIEHTDYIKQITYRTHERTLFHKYNPSKYTFFSSMA